jgi:hypothetical protein
LAGISDVKLDVIGPLQWEEIGLRRLGDDRWRQTAQRDLRRCIHLEIPFHRRSGKRIGHILLANSIGVVQSSGKWRFKGKKLARLNDIRHN